MCTASWILKKADDTLSRPESGFSLVELAISIMVIGLLIGLITKGMELMENSRVTAMASQVNHYETAISAFAKLYGALPGDIRNGARIPNCATAYCQDGGNEDGMIASSHPTDWNKAGDTGGGQEERRVWLHLVLSDLISTINPLYSGDPLEAGQDYPATAIDGGVYDVYYWDPRRATNAPYRFVGGHYLKTKAEPLDEEGGFLTAVQAAKIDRKMDDGLPSSGRVLAWRPNGDRCEIGGGNDAYPQSDKTILCELSFRMSF